MLGKLIKHEFRATGRLMAPLFGALLLLAVFSRVANQILQQVPNPTRVLYIVSVLLAIVYVLAGLGVMVFSTVLMIKRFHQNFLTDEGYLMFTLPVSVHSLLWSKLITAALFFLFTFAAELLALAIVIWQGGVSTELYNNFISGLRELGSYYTGNGIAIALETFAMLFVSLLVTCLLFYAPMSIGYSFANHKGLLSVVFYFVIQAVQQIFGVFTLAGLADDSSLLNHLLQNVFSGGRMVIVNGVVSEAPHAVAQFSTVPCSCPCSQILSSARSSIFSPTSCSANAGTSSRRHNWPAARRLQAVFCVPEEKLKIILAFWRILWYYI